MFTTSSAAATAYLRRISNFLRKERNYYSIAAAATTTTTASAAAAARFQLQRQPTPIIIRRRNTTTATGTSCIIPPKLLLQHYKKHHQQQSHNDLLSLSSLNHNQKRYFARTSEADDSNLSPEIKAKNFIMQTGYTSDSKVAQGVIDALIESGVTGTALLSTVRTMAGRWEVGEDAGLEALVEAVKLQVARTEGREEPITIYCVPANAWKSSEDDQDDFSPIVETTDEHEQMMKRAFTVEATTGLTLTDVAKFGDGDGCSSLGESLECACAGIMACSTCHVVIDPLWYDVVGPPNEDEKDMLDLAYAPRSTSRLGCQIVLDESMDGLIIRLPKLSNNLMDYVPFED